MGMNLQLSASANGTRNIGPVNMGGGPNLVERSLFSSSAPTLPYSQWYVPGNGSPALSTSDYYLTNGIYWPLPYDLDTMGSDGATIKAREGKRYVWLIMTDHGESAEIFAGGSDLMIGYSNDPQIWPDPTSLRILRKFLDSITVVDQNGTTQNTFLIYQTPYLVYNPDPGAFAPFYIYAESKANGFPHQMALLTTSDFLTGTLQGPAIPTTAFGGWSSFGQPRRLGVNDWEVYAFGKPDGTATTPATYKYTSTDGWAWTSTFSAIADSFGPFVTINGTDSNISGDRPGGPETLAYWTVNSDKQRTSGPTAISTAFEDQDDAYPWQTYLQDVVAYEEDGIATINITRGYPIALHDRTNSGPYLGNSPHLYEFTGGSSGTTLTVSAMPGGVPPLAVGFRLVNSSGKPAITAFGTGTGGVGTYTLSASLTVTAGSQITVATNGGLWQQFSDIYSLITDTTAAASAAPLGVRASCDAGVVTIRWNNCLPHSNYRVYRGTTVGTQATLIGDVTGTSITDTPTAGSQYFYKVVTMNGGEQGSRIVDVYASNNVEIVNRHYNRVLNDGGDTSKIDMTFLAAAAAWLTSNDCWKYLNWWVDARFGVKLDGSGFVSKVYCLGTTYLPRGGDYTPTTSNTFPSTSSNTSYSTTSFRGTTPSWINNASSAHGYFGNGRPCNIQRWNEITLLAAYQKPGTASAGLFGMGEFDGMYLRHESGSSGNITFAMSAQMGSSFPYTTATAPFTTATAAHVAAGTQGSNGDLTAYLDGVAGTVVSTSFANPNLINQSVLRGVYGLNANTLPVLASGATSAVKKPNYALSNEALFTGAGLAVFNKDLGATLIQSWGAIYA
jgi:hypothetical protein